MKCPICNGHTKILETRGDRRRHECGQGHRTTTVNERVVRVDEGKLKAGRQRAA